LDAVEGIVHGFTDREGGVSPGPFASLNLGGRIGDDPTNVQLNRRAVLDTLGHSGSNLVSLRQVHGDQVVEVSHMAGRSIQADALWTRDRRAVISALVADCVPLLIADQRARAVAAVHAGWRGTRQRIGARMVERLDAAGFGLADLRVAIGPAVGPCCFAIGSDVADALRAAFPEAGDAIRHRSDGALVADLWALNRLCLIEAGLAPGQIDVLRVCTSCTPTLFSHRRDGTTGRQAGVIALRP